MQIDADTPCFVSMSGRISKMLSKRCNLFLKMNSISFVLKQRCVIEINQVEQLRVGDIRPWSCILIVWILLPCV